MSNPLIAETLGKVNAVAHVLDGVARTGAKGKITTLTILLGPHAPLPLVPALVFPHAVVNTYCACTV